MKTHHLFRETRLEHPLADVFPFFADPTNLEAITPAWLRFHVESSSTDEVELGTELSYRLRLHGVPLRWRSRISVWDPPHRFVDEQVSGPYRLWRHLHTFEPAADDPSATIARDWVEYACLGGPLVHRLLVQPDLRAIFDHRLERMQQLFPPAGHGAPRPIEVPA